jgi:hypothetical protein
VIEIDAGARALAVHELHHDVGMRGSQDRARRVCGRSPNRVVSIGMLRRVSRVGTMFALLVIAAATPVVALASHKPPRKPATVPDCAHLSLAKMGQRLGVSSLVLQGKTPGTNVCTYTAAVPKEYSDLLQISIAPGTRCFLGRGRPYACWGLFVNSEKLAQKVAAQRQVVFGEIGRRSQGIAAVYYVDNEINGESPLLRPCDPPAPPLFLPPPLPAFGPPACFGQPDWSAIIVYSFGRLEPNGPDAFVSVGLSGAVRKVFLRQVSNLNLEIGSTGIR